MARGSCLCGAIRYRVAEPFSRVTHCHCSMCRKGHGSAFGTYGSVTREALVFEAGEDRLAHYPSSERVTRSFCGVCGAKLLFADARTPDLVDVALGTLEDDADVRVDAHIFVASKAGWVEIGDDLPQFPQSSRED